MDVVGMRLAGARAEHGREPVATPPCEPHRLQRGHPPGLMMSLAPFVSSKIRISAAIPSAWALPAFGMVAVAALITSDMNGLKIRGRRPGGCTGLRGSAMRARTNQWKFVVSGSGGQFPAP
jgi:hypothetical protein